MSSPDRVVVGPDFHIRPLLPMLALDRRFSILALIDLTPVFSSTWS